MNTPAPSETRTALGPIQFSDTGEGPALLCLHGAMGGHDQSWLLARALCADLTGHRVLAVSRPGYLRSPLSLGPTPEQQAQLYAALLDALVIDRAIVAAVSAGGPSAIHFALRHPDRCAGLVLVSAPNGPIAGADRNLARIRKMQGLLRVPGLMPLLRWQARRNPLKGIARAVPDSELRRQLLAHPEASALLTALQASTLTELGCRLPGTLHDTESFGMLAPLPVEQLTVPTLVIHAEDDPVVDIGHARRVLEKTRGAEGLVLPNGGHVALFTHLEAVRAAAAGFLARSGA